MVKLACLILLTIPTYADMLLEYPTSEGSTNFSQLLSLTDQEETITEYEMTATGEAAWPVWVDNVSDPAWAQISYNQPVEITWEQGFCENGGAGCADVTWTTSTVDAMFSATPINGNNFVFIGNVDPVPEPASVALVGFVFLLFLPKVAVNALFGRAGSRMSPANTELRTESKVDIIYVIRSHWTALCVSHPKTLGAEPRLTP